VGRVKIYNYGFIVFTVGSGLAALSFTSLELIGSRMVQGVGAAMIVTNAAAILTDATPRNELGKILGMSSVAFRLGSITGLTLSGVILSITDWRALFYINIPIGIFGTVWAHYRLKEISTRDTYRSMDWIGFFAFSGGLGLLLLSMTYLSFGLAEYELGLEMLAVGIGLLLLFIWYELRGPKSAQPILDMKLFKIKEFAGGSLAMMFNAIAWSGILIMVSFYLQVIVGDTPLRTGISLLALDATFIIAAPISGRLSDKYGSRAFVITGLSISSVAFFLFIFINATTDISTVLLALALLGLGTGMWVSPNISSIMGSVPANRRGIASGFRITLSNVGDTLSFGLAILLMTLVIPYGTLNTLIQSYSIQGSILVGKQEFITGFQLVAFVLASINTVAIIPASLAKRRLPNIAKDEKKLRDVQR